VDVSENPEEDLLSARIEQLSLSNLIEFARAVSQVNIPKISDDDILEFKRLNLYISTGVTLLKKYYPAGVQFDCDVTVFGHEGTVDATIGSEVKIKGRIDPFDLGPLTITGANDKKATLDIEIGKETQKIYIDGAVKILDSITSLHLNVEMMPNPVFDFQTKVAFGERLEFDLEAKMTGTLTGKDTKALDFSLKADLEQDFLEYIISEANKHFEALHKAAQDGFQATQAEIEESEKAFDQKLAIAQIELEHAKQVWEKKEKDVHDAFNTAKGEIDAKCEKARADLKNAKADLDKAIQGAEGDLERVKHEMADEVKEAEVTVETDAWAAEKELEKLRRAVGDMQKSLDQAFGSIDDHIRSAEDEIERAQGLQPMYHPRWKKHANPLQAV
jgi:hypothetical protein